MVMNPKQAPEHVDIASIVAQALTILDSEEILSMLGETSRNQAEGQGSLARGNAEDQSLEAMLNWRSVPRQDTPLEDASRAKHQWRTTRWTYEDFETFLGIFVFWWI
jgi:hypothetical protein